jgi:hypothetical protein
MPETIDPMVVHYPHRLHEFSFEFRAAGNLSASRDNGRFGLLL